MRGSYFLVFKLKRSKRVRGWKLREGYYIYVGSGMRGMENRVLRHLRKEKKRHWHIDYLTSDKDCEPVLLLLKLENEKNECKYAAAFSNLGTGIKGFGCSDCRCDSHLFYFGKFEDCEDAIKKVLGDVKK